MVQRVLFSKIRLYKLKAKEKKKSKIKTAYIVEVESSNTFNPHLLPLADFFNFNPSFLILPDIIFNNTPVLFL